MPLLTKMKCDGRLPNGQPCSVEFFVGEPDTVKESRQILQTTDAFLQKMFFCGIDCLRRWAAAYTCPYLEDPDPTPERHISSTRKGN